EDGDRHGRERPHVPDRPRLPPQGRLDQGQVGVRERGLRELPYARRRPLDRHHRAGSRLAQARLPRSYGAGDERRCAHDRNDAVGCSRGPVVADATTGEFLLHVPIPLAEARDAMDAVIAGGFHLNCYLDDLLYVAEVTPEARRYADFQHLEIHAVGDLRAWLDRDPTKLVAVGDPAALDELEAELEPRFAGRLFISKSLPYFLEFAHPDVSKGSGLAFVADRLGFRPEETVACGDGENDRELLDWAAFGVAGGQARVEELRAARKVKGKPTPEQLAELERLKGELQGLEDQLGEAEARRQEILDRVPNPPDVSAPNGDTEEDAVEIRRWGE